MLAQAGLRRVTVVERQCREMSEGSRGSDRGKKFSCPISKAEGKDGEGVSRKEIYEQKAEALAQPIVESRGYELVDVEYVKEAGTWYLRLYIDKEGGITINDCEEVSRLFGDRLDEEDFIEDAYVMEVSSEKGEGLCEKHGEKGGDQNLPSCGKAERILRYSQRI